MTPLRDTRSEATSAMIQNLFVVPAKTKSPDERRAAATSAHTANPITANEITKLTDDMTE